MPTDDDADPSWTPYEPNQGGYLNPYIRQNAVKITPNTRIDQSAIAEVDYDKPFINFHGEILEDLNVDEKIEHLCYSGPDSQTTALIGYPNNNDDPENKQQPLSSFGSGQSTPSGSAEEQLSTKIGRTAKRHLGDAVTVERCNLDLSPLGSVPIATCRLVVPENGNPTPIENLRYRPVVELLATLRDAGCPYLYQVLLRKSGSAEYEISIRLTVFDPDYSVDTDDGLFKLYDRGHPYDLNEFFNYSGVTTNFQLNLAHYYSLVHPRFESLVTKSYIDFATLRDGRNIKTGKVEFERLLQARLVYNNHYEKYLGYPKFPIQSDSLLHFIALVAAPYDTNPWSDVQGRSAPVEHVTGDPLGSNEWGSRSVRTSQIPKQHRSGSSATAGSEFHDRNLEEIIALLRQRGYTVVKLEQDGDSLPDAVAVNSDGDIVFIEHEQTVGKPDNYLKNVARAIYHDVDLILCTEEKDDIETIANNIRVPYNTTDNTDLGVRLFNRTDSVSLDQNVKPVLPKGVSKSKWYVTPSHDLVLYGGEEQLAKGPCTDSVATFDYDCPRYHKKGDDKHVVVSSTGTELTRYRSESALTDEWSIVRLPHLPLRLSYAGSCDLFYRGWNGLEEYDGTPPWTQIDSKMERYRKLIEDLYETFTVPSEGDDIPMREFLAVLRDYGELVTNKKLPPDKQRLGQATPGEYERGRKGEGGTDGTSFLDRRWVYPRDVVSSDLPDFDKRPPSDLVDDL